MKIADSPEATIGVDDAGAVVAWNHAAEQLFGVRENDAVGRLCHEIMHGMTPGGMPLCGPDCAAVQLCRHGDTPRRFEMVLPRADGNDVWLDVTSVTLDEDGRRLTLHVFTESVSARRLSLVAEDVVRKVTALPKAPDAGAGTLIETLLSAREVEILRLLGRGWTSERIARELHIAPVTVRNHVQRVLAKLGVHNRTEAVMMAARAGLIQMHQES